MSGTTQVWNRLEPRPRTNSLERAVRAEVRDALWMVSRQWQLGEFNADDTGTATFARLDMQTTRINRIAKKGDNYVDIDESMPLECLVEREPVVPDLMHKIELGRTFMKFFKKRLTDYSANNNNALSASDISTALDNVRNTARYQFALPNNPPSAPDVNYPDFYSSPELWQATLTIRNGRSIDGLMILGDVKPSNVLATKVTFTSNDPQVPVQLTAAGNDFLAWYNGVYSQPGAPGTEDYWLPENLEYQFACSAPKDATAHTVVSAKEYYQGNLDWYSFNIQDSNPSYSLLVAGSPDTSKIGDAPFTLIPAKIKFGGMPAPRYWEMEDRRIDIGNISASTTDVAQILVAEFALLYSNDWTLVPYTVPTGSICNLRKVLVTDVFGQVTYITSGCTPTWNMYTLKTEGSTANDTRLFIPPVIQNKEEGDFLESVTFMQDEMANMTWAVETTISDGVSKGQDGKGAAQRFIAFLEAGTTSLPPGAMVSNTADVQYNVMTRIPENWIPFTPVNRGTLAGRPAVQLQRAAMPRQILNNLPSGRVRPRTSLVRAGSPDSNNKWNPSFIWAEEVPRSGAVLSMNWQRARWHQGQVAVWLGRQKQNGRGEGNSALRFDYLTAK